MTGADFGASAILVGVDIYDCIGTLCCGFISLSLFGDGIYWEGMNNGFGSPSGAFASSLFVTGVGMNKGCGGVGVGTPGLS